LDDLFISEADDGYSKPVEFCRTVFIMFLYRQIIMNSTVDLYDQSFFMTIKIGNIKVYRVLPSKFQPLKPAVFQPVPKHFLSFCHGMPQCMCPLKRLFRSVQMQKKFPAFT